MAKPLFSLPNLHALQKKFLKKKRRRKKRRHKRKLKNAAPVIGAPLLGGQSKQANPPLPVRNPRHLKRNNNKDRTASTRWVPKPPSGRPSPIAKKDIKPIEKKAIGLATTLPPLPFRKPRRHPSQMKEPDWTPKLIRIATKQCTTLGITITPLAPVKKGLCGNPAPVLLPKIGIASVRPAATLSCPMVANLQRWFTEDVQPLALKHFGKKVREIRNISSYVCRNRYGDTNTRISEHAYANALDISQFELIGGEKISVEKDWENTAGEKSTFLHALHSSACKRFGTVLGPDANAAHKNHFHLDNAPRKRSNYCR